MPVAASSLAGAFSAIKPPQQPTKAKDESTSVDSETSTNLDPLQRAEDESRQFYAQVHSDFAKSQAEPAKAFQNNAASKMDQNINQIINQNLSKVLGEDPAKSAKIS